VDFASGRGTDESPGKYVNMKITLENSCLGTSPRRGNEKDTRVQCLTIVGFLVIMRDMHDMPFPLK
jgi:hypothetical protein